MSGYDPAKVRYLKEFYTTAEIRGFWKDLGDTDRDFAQNPIQINSHSQDGESSGGITVRNAGDAAVWFASAEQAYREKLAADEGSNSNLIAPEDLGRGTDYSQRMVRA